MRPDDGDAGKGGESKRTPPGNRADTDIVSSAKASPLFSGLSSRESLTNRHKHAKQMKAERSVGAASDISGHWREIDWRTVTGEVRRLQVRIVKALETGRWGKVKALQRLLTTSRSGKLLAVRRVTENQGRKTPEVDGESWDTPEKKMNAVGTLRGRGYLWRTQGGKCPACGLPISRETGWHSHHVVPKVLGGHDGATNRQLLHPECHRQLHSRCVSQEAFGRLEPCELETLTHGS